MSTTPNHLVLSRTQLAEASELADTGSALMARTRLLSAADHALIALAAHSAVGVSQAGAQLDRPAIALRLAELGATPDDLLPSRLTPGFGLVQALIDASLTHQVSPPARTAPVPMPMYGGARGAINARGAEAAARGLTRVVAAVRGALRP